MFITVNICVIVLRETDPVHILPGESIEILSNNMDCDTYVWWWNTIPPDSDSIPLPALNNTINWKPKSTCEGPNLPLQQGSSDTRIINIVIYLSA